MPVVTINEAWNKGVLAKTSRLILPVQEREITLSWEETGVCGEGQKLSTKGIRKCHCISTGRMEYGMLKIIGETMPIYLGLTGAMGASRGPEVMHYVSSMLFGLPPGISACHITLHDWKKYKKRLGLTSTAWHWLATNYDSIHSYSGVFSVGDDDVNRDDLYLAGRCMWRYTYAIRPVYYLSIYNPNIQMEVPKEGEELRLILP